MIFGKKEQMVCLQCKTVAVPKRVTPGSFLIEIVLYCFLIFPGLIYTIWRNTSKHDQCPACKSKNLIPKDTPMARDIIAS